MNPEQLAAINAPIGPLAILAGAGTGKTHTLVERVKRLVEEGHRANRILLVSFSSDAAKELRRRFERVGLKDVDVATWHSLAWRVLREDETDFASWEIDTKGQIKRVIGEACGPKGIDWRDADHAGLARLLGLAAANLWTPDDLGARAAVARLFGAEARIALDAWAEIERICGERRLLTFDRMLSEFAFHLGDEGAREWWSARWDHVLQDEYQDTNRALVVLAEMLAREHRSYVVVGDPGQSIYGFRGSAPSWLMEFAATWNAPVVSLLRNYRSGARILDVGNAIIAPARERLPDALIAERGVPGSVSVITADDQEDEAELLAEHITREQSSGARWSDFAVLMRTNALSRAVEEAFLRRQIPHVIRGALPFFQRREVRSLLAYLRVAVDRADDDDLRACINTPNRYLGREFVGSVMIHRQARESWTDAVALAAAQDRIWSKQRVAAKQWAEIIENVARGVALGQAPAQLLEHVTHVTGYLDWLARAEGDGEQGEGRGAAVRELLSAARRFSSVSALLDFADRAEQVTKRTGEEIGDRVVVSSIHKSKGLEWPRVWVIGCVDGVLPLAQGDAEEERRLAYVAVTRARDELTLSWWMSQSKRDVAPSPFLRDAGLIEVPGRVAA